MRHWKDLAGLGKYQVRIPDLSEKTVGTILRWVAGPDRQKAKSWQSMGSLQHTAGAGCTVCQQHRSVGKVGSDVGKSVCKMFLVLLAHSLRCTPGAVTVGSVLTCHVAICLYFGRNILGYLGWRYLG